MFPGATNARKLALDEVDNSSLQKTNCSFRIRTIMPNGSYRLQAKIRRRDTEISSSQSQSPSCDQVKLDLTRIQERFKPESPSRYFLGDIPLMLLKARLKFALELKPTW